MADNIRIKKGLDLNLLGAAEATFAQAPQAEFFAIKPTDFHGLTPKLSLKPGAKVKAGTSLFYDKYNPDVKFASPVSGELVDVVRGERRRILQVVVKADATIEYEDFGSADPASLSKEDVIKKLLDAGLWPFFKQRPYDIIANPIDDPKEIFISGFDSAPLAPDYDLVLKGEEANFQAGINALTKLTAGKVYVGASAESESKVYKATKGIELVTFDGPHPAGNVGVQIHHISPINKGEKVWTLKPQDVVAIGRLFLTGKLDLSRVINVVGSEVTKPAYYKVIAGTSVKPLLNGNLNKSDYNLRVISGNVLNGTHIAQDGFLSAYDSQVSVIPEGDQYDFLGWANPGFNVFSSHKTFLSFICKNKKWRMNANIHGGPRAIVASGEYDKVLPMDILPEFLVKSIIVEDIDKMEQLGIYEVAPEDFALCEFVCTSKLELQRIVREGLDVMVRELG